MQAPTLVSECLGFMPEVENLNANPTKGDQHEATWNTVSHTSYALLIFCVYIRSMKSHLNTKHFLFNLLCFPFDFVVSAVLPSYSFLFIFFFQMFSYFPRVPLSLFVCISFIHFFLLPFFPPSLLHFFTLFSGQFLYWNGNLKKNKVHSNCQFSLWLLRT